MPAVRGNFSDLLVPGARKVFVDDYQDLAAEYPKVFNVDTSGKAFEDDLVLTGLPLAPSKPEGEPIAFDRPIFRGKVRYVHAGFGLGYEITREAVEDDLYGALNKKGAGNLALSMRETEEVTAWDVFNSAFMTIQAYDEVALISTSHADVNGNSLPNRPAADEDLSVSALKSSLERWAALTTDRGIPIVMNPSSLVVPPENWWTALEVTKTQVVTTTAAADGIESQEAVNVASMMGLTPMRIIHLTDPDSWYTVAPKGTHKLNFFWRRKPDPTDGFDDRAEISWFGITARFDAGVTDFRGIDGSPGA